MPGGADHYIDATPAADKAIERRRYDCSLVTSMRTGGTAGSAEPAAAVARRFVDIAKATAAPASTSPALCRKPKPEAAPVTERRGRPAAPGRCRSVWAGSVRPPS